MNLDWDWLRRNADDIALLLGQHALLAIIPVVAALVVAIPLGYLVFKTSRAANPILAVFGVIYSIPSLALFVALPSTSGRAHSSEGPSIPGRSRSSTTSTGT